MGDVITIFINSKADTNLYKQLAKRLKNKVIETKEPKLKSKEQFLDDLSESIQEMRLHEQGKIKLKSAKEVLNEL